MSDSSRVKAPRLALDEQKQVVDRDTGERLEGIVVLNEQAPLAPPAESPFTAMRRWSQFRQALVKPRL